MEPSQSTSSFSKPQQNLPNANGSFVLGILSLIAPTVLCICYGYFIGVILGIIGLVLGSGAKKRYALNPEEYTEQSFKKAKTGVTLSMIGLILSLLITVGIIALVVMGMNGSLPPEMQDAFEKQMRRYK